MADACLRRSMVTVVAVVMLAGSVHAAVYESASRRMAAGGGLVGEGALC